MPFLVPALSLLLGVLVGSRFPVAAPVTLWWVVVASLSGWTAFYWRFEVFVCLAVVCGFFASGHAVTAAAAWQATHPSIRTLVDPSADRRGVPAVLLEGRLLEDAA